MYRIVKLFILAMLLIINGCDIDLSSEPISKDELVGEYIANYNAGKFEKLIIYMNGNYVHIFESKTGSTFVDTNSWELINELGNINRPTITFYGFIDRYPIDAHCFTIHRGKVNPTSYDWGTYIRRRGENIRIERCSAMHQYYIKQNESLVEYSCHQIKTFGLRHYPVVGYMIREWARKNI
ncbi:MAG: hypothetical protein ABIJ45_11475 [Candidatus Zixiibacteriota bacterium]